MMTMAMTALVEDRNIPPQKKKRNRNISGSAWRDRDEVVWGAALHIAPTHMHSLILMMKMVVVVMMMMMFLLLLLLLFCCFVVDKQCTQKNIKLVLKILAIFFPFKARKKVAI